MTFRELIAAHPDRFYSQTWYEDEAFMGWPCSYPIRLPKFFSNPDISGLSLAELATFPRACMLAELFLKYPQSPIWMHYLWCADTDHLGQRVYVGGATLENGNRFEIHRHLHLTGRWGVCVW